MPSPFLPSSFDSALIKEPVLMCTISSRLKRKRDRMSVPRVIRSHSEKTIFDWSRFTPAVYTSYTSELRVACSEISLSASPASICDLAFFRPTSVKLCLKRLRPVSLCRQPYS